MSGFEILKARGFVEQCTDPDAVAAILREGSVAFYVGFDPTADSLHAGSLLPIMAMAHLQRAGHHPVAVVGGGTALVGDPSGRTEMRRLMSAEAIGLNAQSIRGQLERFLVLDGIRGTVVDNADWLQPLGYIEFLRDIGRHFRVNEMIKMDSVRQRLEREEGLSFIEFNYQLLQAFDFLTLSRRHQCRLQMGGSDQWGNIVAGIDLIRRLDGRQAYGLTFPLLTTARGEKMGKTAEGAVWLSADRLSSYGYYQFWINTADADTRRFLAYFTLRPMDEVERLGSLRGADLREAKEVLAFEATSLLHGSEEAEKARAASRAAFAAQGSDLSAIPSSTVPAAGLEAGIPIVDLLVQSGLAGSRNAARRLIQQGGAYVNGRKVADSELLITTGDLEGGGVMLRAGKKTLHRLVPG